MLGPQTWKIENDLCPSTSCFNNKGSCPTLILTGCNDAEFTCNTTQCVTMAQRCDGQRDCEDGSDEDECMPFALSVGYKKFQVPNPLNQSEKLKMNFSLDLHEVIEINELEHFFRAKISLKRTWFDSHLTFHNLKKESSNEISTTEIEHIWTQGVMFDNTEDREKFKRTDKPEVYKIIPNSDFDFKVAENTYLYNTYLFDGSTNALYLEKQFTVEWLCDFNMEWYPFDTQSCTMQFRNTRASVDLLPGNITYYGSQNLRQHIVQDVKMCSTTIKGDQVTVVEVILGRPLFSFFLTTTLPTSLLIIISQMTATFSGEYLDMVIQVNLTVLLVEATL